MLGGRAAYLSRIDAAPQPRRAPCGRPHPIIADAAGFDPQRPLTADAHHLAPRRCARVADYQEQRRTAQLAALDEAAGHGDRRGARMRRPRHRRSGRLACAAPSWSTGCRSPATPGRGRAERGAGPCTDGRDRCRGTRRGPVRRRRTAAHARRGCTSPTPTPPTPAVTPTWTPRRSPRICTPRTEAGVTAGFHVIGDAAVSAVTDALHRVVDEFGGPAVARCGHRLEHLEMVTAEQAAALGRWGVIGSVQPNFDAYWGGPDGMYAQRLGVSRAATLNPFALLASQGRAPRLRFRQSGHRAEPVGDRAGGDPAPHAGQRCVGPRGVLGGHPRRVAGRRRA